MHVEHATNVVVGDHAKVNQTSTSQAQSTVGASLGTERQLAEIAKILRVEFEALKRGQAAIYHQIDQSSQESLQKILALVQMGRIEQGEMASTLEAIRRTLQAMQTSETAFSTEMQEAIAGLHKAVVSDLGLQQKLELTLPVLPMFLTYKVEWTAGSKADLNAVRKELEERWRKLVDRTAQE